MVSKQLINQSNLALLACQVELSIQASVVVSLVIHICDVKRALVISFDPFILQMYSRPHSFFLFSAFLHRRGSVCDRF